MTSLCLGYKGVEETGSLETPTLGMFVELLAHKGLGVLSDWKSLCPRFPLMKGEDRTVPQNQFRKKET